MAGRQSMLLSPNRLKVLQTAMLRFTVLLLVLGVPVQAQYNYCIAPAASHYSKAVEWCTNRSMVLVMPKSDEENRHAGGACSSKGTKGACWLGLTENATREADWSWDDGTPLHYSNWASNDMRNYKANEQHAAIFPVEAGDGVIMCCRKWYDVLDGRGYYFAACQTTDNNTAASCPGGRFVTAAEAAAKATADDKEHATSNVISAGRGQAVETWIVLTITSLSLILLSLGH